MQEKVPAYEYVHSVRIELAKLILVGARITYQATGDAGAQVQLMTPTTSKSVVQTSTSSSRHSSSSARIRTDYSSDAVSQVTGLDTPVAVRYVVQKARGIASHLSANQKR